MGGCRFEGPLTAQWVMAVLGEAVENAVVVAGAAEVVRSGCTARRRRSVAVVPVRVRERVADGRVFAGPKLHDQAALVAAREVRQWLRGGPAWTRSFRPLVLSAGLGTCYRTALRDELVQI